MQLLRVLTVAAGMAGFAAAQSGTSFNTVETWTDAFGSCGSPGLRACASLNHSCATASGNSIRIDPNTAQDNCDLPSPSCTALPLWAISNANPDVSFWVITDTHLLHGYKVPNSDHVRHAFNLNLVPGMGFKWSQAGAGFDQTPLGAPTVIVSTGDDTDYGQQVDLGAYRMLYEGALTSDSLNYMTLPGLGNHDVEGQCAFANCGRRMFDYVAAAAQCVASVDPDSHNYSWNFGPFHLIQLNEWYGSTSLGSDTATGYSPTHSSGLSWLIADLAANAVSGRKVILFQHFGWDFFSIYHNDFTGETAPWWTAAQRQELLNIIAPYDVIAMFSGHQHQAAMYSANYSDSQGNHKVLDDFTGGTGGIGGKGEFYAVRLTSNFLDVLPFEWNDSANGTLPYMTTVGNLSYASWPGGEVWTGGAEAGTSPMPDGTPIYPGFYNPVNGCRKWIGAPLQKVPVSVSFDPNNPYGVIIKNNTGAVINGPFALQMSIPTGGKLNSVSFMGTCSQGPAYQQFNLTELLPGQSDEITLTVSGYSTPPASTYNLADLSVVTLGSDSLLESADTVTVAAGSDAKVNLSTVFGKNIPFTYQVNGRGYKVGVDATQTPAVMTIGVDTGTAQIDKSATVAILPGVPGYAALKVSIALGTVPVRVTSKTGDPFTVDGQTYGSAHTFAWYPLDHHRLNANVVTLNAGTQDRLTLWSATGATLSSPTSEQQDILAPFYATTYTAAFARYYQVSSTVTPAAGGVVSILPPSSDGFYLHDTSITVQATPNTGYVFSTFQDVYPVPTGSSFSVNVTVPLKFSAAFTATGTYTVTSNLGAGGSELVDGVTYAGPASLTWTSGTSHTFSVPALITPAPGVRDVFTGWSDGSSATSRTVTAGATFNFVANYQLQYQVTTAVSPTGGGTLTGAGWYNGGSPATLQATAANGFTFSGFSGGLSGSGDPQTVAVNKPVNVVANFQPGTAILYASAGPRNDSDPNISNFTFVLTNTGAGAAANAQIDSVAARTVLGSGSVTFNSWPLPFGTIVPGQAASQTISFSWPSTAKRVGFTVSFSANGGAYHGQTTFYVIR